MAKRENELTALCTINAYAKHFNVSKSTIYSWIRIKRLKQGYHYVRIGRVLRFFLNNDLIRELHEPVFKAKVQTRKCSPRKIKKINLNR